MLYTNTIRTALHSFNRKSRNNNALDCVECEMKKQIPNYFTSYKIVGDSMSKIDTEPIDVQIVRKILYIFPNGICYKGKTILLLRAGHISVFQS